MRYADGWDHMDGGWMVMGGLIWIVLVILVVALLLLAVRAWAPRGPGLDASQVHDPRGVLDDRLARGEIDVEEYDGIRERLAGRR